MSWINKLFAQDSYDPELYDRVPCSVCSGRGIVAASATPADLRQGLPRLRSCGGCGGKGYLLVRKRE